MAAETCRFLLSERDTQPLVTPLGSSGRIKYTCVAVSAHYIALGANTGGVYCFHSRDYRYIQLLANKEGSVSLVRFSPDEQFLAVVAGGGTLVVWELHLTASRLSKRLHVSSLLKDSVVQDVVWEGKGGRLFYGDSQGRVAVASLPKLAVKSGLFRRLNEIIFQDKSPVVQLDHYGDMLLVSTHSRAVLLKLTSTNRIALQVGKKSRDGPFGACFDVRESDQQLLVYSARPGGRLWEADTQGDVKATVKLRGLFSSTATPLLGHGFDPVFSPSSPPPSLPLPYLYTLHNGRHLVSWDETGLYLWQPSSWQLAAWTTDLSEIVGVSCEGGRSDAVTVCVLVEGGRKVLVLTMETLLHSIQFLVKEQLLDQATKLVCGYTREVVSLLPSHPSLLPSLSTILQHTLTSSHNSPPPEQLQTIQLEVEKINKEHEAERETEATLMEETTKCMTSNDVVEPSQDSTQEAEATVRETRSMLEVTERCGELQLEVVPTMELEDKVDGCLPLYTTIPNADQPSHVSESQTIRDGCEYGEVTPQVHDDVMLYDRPTVHGRIHRKSNSWSGVPDDIMVSDTPLTPDRDEGTGQADDDGECFSLSESHTSSQLSKETLSREPSLSQDLLSPEAPWLEASTTLQSTEAPWLEASTTLQSTEAPWLEASTTQSTAERPVTTRSQSLQLLTPPTRPHIAMATLLDQDSDDVIAVPVRSSAAAGEVGSKSRSKRRSRRSKKPSTSSLPSSLPSSLHSNKEITSPSLSSQVAEDLSLSHILEEGDILPFPDAGLPVTEHPLSTPKAADIVEADSTHTLQRGSSFVSKMKELAKQGGQNMGLEAEALQDALNQPVRKVKELLSSLTAPAPTALSIPTSKTVFVNEDYVIPQPLPTTGVYQSDGSLPSHDVSPTSLPLSPQEQQSTLQTITMETLSSLTLPDVYCTSTGVQTVLTSWLLAMENAVDTEESSVQSVEEATLVDLLTLCLEVCVYGSQSDIISFLCHYSIRLNGVRTMRVLRLQEWEVRCAGWKVLVGGRMPENRGPAEGIMELTNQKARAPDLPTFLTSLLTFDPESLVTTCVECWPAVQPWQMAMLCYTDQSDCNAESADKQPFLDVYASYLAQLLGYHKGVWEEVRRDEEMVLASLEMLLKSGPPLNQLAGAEGRPLAWSHKCTWPHGPLLANLVDMCVTMTTKHHFSQATSICEKFGYWLGAAQLAATGGDRGKSLLIILSLRDATLLQKTQKWGNLLLSVSDWQEALQIMTNSASGGTSSHDNELTMTVLVYMMLDSVGPTLSSHILTSVGGLEGVASGEEGAELHSLMVQLAAIHAQQKRVARSLLEKVDGYLWSRQPAALSPQLQSLEEKEREARRVAGGSTHEQDLIQTDMEWKPTLEDSGRHWGMRVGGRKAECGICKLPLSVVMSEQQPGVLFFHCGHTYHRHCIPELACYICFKKNFTSHFLSKPGSIH